MTNDDIDISAFMLNPFDKATIKKLEQYDEFKEDFGIDKPMLLSYMILLLDFNSQLRKEIPVYGRRKVEAGMIAGFKVNKTGRFEENVENMMVGQNEAFNKAAIKYINLFGKPEYIELVYLWSILSFESQNAFSKNSSQDYQRTIKNISILTSRINELTELLYGGKEVIDARKALYEFVEKDRLRIRPEDVAEDLEKGVPILGGYEAYDGYKPSKLKFTNKPKQ